MIICILAFYYDDVTARKLITDTPHLPYLDFTGTHVCNFTKYVGFFDQHWSQDPGHLSHQKDVPSYALPNKPPCPLFFPTSWQQVTWSPYVRIYHFQNFT